MKVLIVAKTRRGAGACIGAISETGKSVRLIAHDFAHNERAGLEYEVGQVWEVELRPDPDIVPPHIENSIVYRAKLLRNSDKVTEIIDRFMPPITGGPEKLFDGCARATTSGGLYVCKDSGLPSRSTMFWIADQPLRLDFEGKRIRYRYPTSDGGRALTFVGFQEPVPEIAAGTLLRVSLAHWWRPEDKPEEEQRCYVQLSGWFPSWSEVGTKPLDVGSARSATPASENGPGKILRQQALELLKSTFGFTEFLPMQWEVIHRVLQAKDTLVVMTTGGGKSLCFQLPALLGPGLTVVVSPLIALMRDQVRQLEQVGVRAACLNHLVPLREYELIMHQVRAGHIRLLYLSPETLLRPETLLLLEQSRLACVAIDEAHCISEWGHDFRPEYRQLAALRGRFPKAAWIALTATATARVREDMRRLLGIPPEAEFIASFNRKNLFIASQKRDDCLAQVLAFLQPRRGQSGIIYCGKRKQTDELCAELNANGWPAVTYHAGMDGEERNRNHEKFINDAVPLVVATIAFGMGINKSNVRFVIHAHMPKDLESYYQEIGRAGRDGLPASCLLLYGRGDALLHRRFIEQGAHSERMGRKARLEAMVQFAEARECRRKPLLAYFDEVIETGCGNCDNCRRGATQTEEFAGPLHTGLLQKLKALRKRLADEAQMPAFYIFSDRTLLDIAQRLPQTREQFLAVHGVGELKLTNYGQQFLEVIRDHCSGSSELSPVSREIKRLPGTRAEQIVKLFEQGQTFEQIAASYQVKPQTVVGHLQRFQQSGGSLDPKKLLSESKLEPSQRARVLEIFQHIGPERLAPVYQALEAKVPYQELHLLRLYWLCRAQKQDI